MKLLDHLQVFRITVCICVCSFLSLCTLNFWKILYYVKYRWPFKSLSHIRLAGKQLILIQKYLGTCGKIVKECVSLQPLSYLWNVTRIEQMFESLLFFSTISLIKLSILEERLFSFILLLFCLAYGGSGTMQAFSLSLKQPFEVEVFSSPVDR